MSDGDGIHQSNTVGCGGKINCTGLIFGVFVNHDEATFEHVRVPKTPLIGPV